MIKARSRLCKIKEPGCRISYTPFSSFQKCCINRACSEEVTRRAKSKAYDDKTKELKAAVVKTRSKWYDQLQKLVNQYVLHVRDAGKPCCTCGTTNNIKYDAGHCYTRKARPEIRFELSNIHKQCSVQCNQHGSGERAKYEPFIVDKYGQDHLDWLKGPHKTLSQQFITTDDIDAEIKRYRVIIRAAGLKPST